jgi:hypothetical protein
MPPAPTVRERRKLARQARKRLNMYLFWLGASGRDEDKARAALLEAQADIIRLVSLTDRIRSPQ